MPSIASINANPDQIIKKQIGNFFGTERIDSSGKKHYQWFAMKGNGTLQLTKDAILFEQWLTQKEYHIPLEKIKKVEVKPWHNLKVKWPGKVLRIFFIDGEETKIIGVRFGLNSGWKDDAYIWQHTIEQLMNDNSKAEI